MLRLAFYGAIWWGVGLSLFNAMLLFWLGITIFLNAEKRNRGVYLITSGLLLGTLFFISHTIIMAYELTFFGIQQLNFWWYLGWIPVIVAPFLWYTVILWYTGFWDGGTSSRLYRRHRYGFWILRLVTLIFVLVLLFAHPLPSYRNLVELDLSNTFAIAGIPFLFVAYPPFAILALLLPIDALLNPEPSQRMLGDAARLRSRPWLIGVSVVMLAIVCMAVLFIGWVVLNAETGYRRNANDYSFSAYNGFLIISAVVTDTILNMLVTLVILLLGKGVVSYEVFTGRTLPREGFARQWRYAIYLGFGVAMVASCNIVVQAAFLYSLLLLVFLVMLFLALSGWRSFVYRDLFLDQLRPFVRQSAFWRTTDASQSHAYAMFQTICTEILDTEMAYLVPLGILAPLAGNPLRYPATQEFTFKIDQPSLAGLDLHVPIFAIHMEGLCWAIPLWDERGLIGILMIGRKRKNSVYAQEDIEIARTSAERIIDLLAGEEMARRLLQLQRQRQVQTRFMDMQTRRALHDDILPNLHMAVLQVSALPAERQAVQEVVQSLTAVHRQISSLIHAPTTTNPAIRLHGHWTQVLKETIEENFARQFDHTTWYIGDNLPDLDEMQREILFAAVSEVVRNAATHGRGDISQQPLNLAITIEQTDRLILKIIDDGIGLGLPSPAKGGSGGGLALHSTMLAIIGGTLEIGSATPQGTQVIIRLL